jgi:hypothetical protein
MFLRKQFLEQVSRKMSDEKVIRELTVGDVREVMVVTVNPENMKKALHEHRYECQNRNPTRAEAQYIAFYETQGPKRVRYIARVKKTEINVQVGDEILKVYSFEKPVELKKDIILGNRPAQFQVLYTTFDRVLNASTLDDLSVK